MIERDAAADLWRAVYCLLPRREADLLWLQFAGDMTAVEAAQQIGIHYSSAARVRRQALLTLREKLPEGFSLPA